MIENVRKEDSDSNTEERATGLQRCRDGAHYLGILLGTFDFIVTLRGCLT